MLANKRTDTPLPSGDLAHPAVPFRLAALCFVLTLVVYLAFVPRFILYSSPPTGDQPFYLLDTISLVQDGDLELSNNYADRDEDKFYRLAPHPPDFVGMSAPYPLPRQLAVSVSRPPEEMYSYHPPGLGLMLVPAWVVGSWFSLWWPATVVFMCLLGALLVTNVFMLAYEATGRKWVAVAVWVALAFSSPIMSYSYLIFTELPAGLAVIYAFRRLALGWNSNGWARLLLVGICTGFIPWLAVRCMPIALALGLYSAVQFWRGWLEVAGQTSQGAGDVANEAGAGKSWCFQRMRLALERVRGEVRRAIAPPLKREFGRYLAGAAGFFAPVAIMFVMLGAYHIFLNGSIWPPTEEREGSGVGWFNWPWVGTYELRQFVTGAFGLLYSQRFGLLTFAPVYVLSAVGLFAMWRRGRAGDRRLVKWIALVCVPYMLLMAAYSGWGGDWCPPGRYACTLVPLLAAPLGVSLAELAKSIVYKVLYVVLALPGFAFMAVMMYDARTMFSATYSAVFEWIAQSEQSPVHIDLRFVLPGFVMPDTVWHPVRTGWPLAASIVVTLLGVYLVVLKGRAAQGRLWESRGRERAHILTAAGTLALIIAAWVFLNYDFLRHKTTLTYTRSWALNSMLPDAGNIAFLDDKIYIPEFGQRVATGWLTGTVGVLDTVENTYSLLRAMDSDGIVLPWAHPSSVTVGPDGLLYVLNNGEGDEALYSMEIDGRVIDQIPLNNKSISGGDLHFGEDRTIYIADQELGEVLKYERTGGDPIATYTGMESILNNPRSVAVDPRGSIYTTETYNRIQKLNADGKLSSLYELYCTPRYFAESPLSEMWLEASCSTGLVSINTKENYTQLVQFVGGDIQPQSPRGVTYGANNLLYVMEGNRILEYKVTH